MPQPPLLQVIDWEKIFDSGAEYEAWIAGAEDENRQQRMVDAVDTLNLAPHYAAMLNALPRKVHVIAIAEDWCGDVVRHVPVLQKIAAASSQVAVRFITREAHKEVFVRFLTNGGEAIPKFVFLNDCFVECANWGPMPHGCRELIARGKACGNAGDARKKVSAHYDVDTNRDVVFRELLECIDIAVCDAP